MGIYQFGVPKDLVKKLQEFGDINVFVETGTFTGNTTRWASEVFQKVYTVEIVPELREEAMRLSEGVDNIEFLLGNSREILPAYKEAFGETVLFWLDGHYSGGATGGKNEQCPLMEELSSIVGIKNVYILIDDARCFMGRLPEPYGGDHWPRVDEIFSFLTENFPNNRFTIHDDVIISVPEASWHVVEDNWENKYWDRYPKGKNNNYDSISFVEKCSQFVKYRILQNS
ncbi:MAG: hypothetical protein AAF388_01230 [Bacteroidota bacterium]